MDSSDTRYIYVALHLVKSANETVYLTSGFEKGMRNRDRGQLLPIILLLLSVCLRCCLLGFVSFTWLSNLFVFAVSSPSFMMCVESFTNTIWSQYNCSSKTNLVIPRHHRSASTPYATRKTPKNHSQVHVYIHRVTA